MLNNNTAKTRYELIDDDKLVAIAAYQRTNDTVTFVHTEVMTGYEDQGYASELARQALDEAGRLGLNVVPACSFIADFIGKNPEYQKLVSDQ
jgi:predicted GNAT family acetyltransferase